MTVSRDRSGSGPLCAVRPAGYFKALASVMERIPLSVIDDMVDAILLAYRERHMVFVYGNGGSAALASHCACDLGKGTAVPDAPRLRIASLTDNIPLISAWANDSAYEHIFDEQLRNFLQPGDVSFAISGSGNSQNVLNALRFSRERGAVNIGLTGFAGGELKDLCDICLIVPSDNMQFIEDLHVSVMHSIYSAVRHRIAQAALVASAGTVIGS